MATARASQKTMHIGEGTSALAFAGSGASLHRDCRQGLHAGIRVPRLSLCSRQHRGGVCHHQSLLRAPGRTRAADHRWQAQLQHGTGQVLDRRCRVLGHCRLHRRTLHRARTGVSASQFRFALDHLRAAAAAAHIGGDLRVWRQRADRDVTLCRATHLPRAAGRRDRAVVRRARLQFLHRHCRHGLSCSASRSPRNMPSRNGMPTCS